MSDNLIDRLVHLKRKMWSGPLLPDLDERGKRLYFRGCDLTARLCLNGEGAALFDTDRHAACTLLHAERYLADRLAYELEPWPKGMMKIETEDAYRLPWQGDLDTTEDTRASQPAPDPYKH